MKIFSILIFLFSLIIQPIIVEAANTESVIENEINVSTSTGGNQVDNGEVITGDSSVKVKVENTINGESIEPININVQSEEGNQKIEVKNEINVNNNSAEVKSEIKTNQGVEKREYTTDLNDSNQNTEEVRNIFEIIYQWCVELINNLIEKLENIL